MSQKPNLLIFGGMYGMAQAVIQYLVPPHPNEPLVAHVRLRDKYSLSPPTTFVGKDFLALIENRKDMIEYKQANLTNPAVVAECFNEPAPNNQSYTHILDFTGNATFSHSAAIQIVQTFNIGLNIAREAQKHGIKAIVRHQPPWYEHLDPAAKYKEEDVNGWKPMGIKGVWWHETLRAMGSIPGLPFCVVRCGYVYGPGLYVTEPSTGTVIGFIHKHLGEVIKFPWSSNARKNTIHSEDLVVALWNVLEWMASTGRDAANSKAGVNLPPTNDPEVSSVSGAIASGEVVVPVFNAVDDGDTTLQTMGGEIAKVFGLQIEFCGSDAEELQGMSEMEFMEYVNDIHVGEWAKIITNSTPPVPRTPLTPYAQTYRFGERGCALDGTKLKEMFSFRPKYPHFDASSIRSWIEWCRQQGIWPEGPLYP